VAVTQPPVFSTNRARPEGIEPPTFGFEGRPGSVVKPPQCVAPALFRCGTFGNSGGWRFQQSHRVRRSRCGHQTVCCILAARNDRSGLRDERPTAGREGGGRPPRSLPGHGVRDVPAWRAAAHPGTERDPDPPRRPGGVLRPASSLMRRHPPVRKAGRRSRPPGRPRGRACVCRSTPAACRAGRAPAQALAGSRGEPVPRGVNGGQDPSRFDGRGRWPSYVVAGAGHRRSSPSEHHRHASDLQLPATSVHLPLHISSCHPALRLRVGQQIEQLPGRRGM